MDYYSPFWGPKAISMVVEFQGALTCRSSTIIVWADSGPFLGLLLIVLGSGVISTINEPRGAFMCRSSTLVVFVSSDPFRGQFWGPEAISMVVEPRGVNTRNFG